ncbi:MAG: restriction endonuclease subunit S [Desulfobacterales bacterium]|uniref:Restriction endonuclease subunit S n=1 Tax=Candidatus Desulfatibia profunda TaxID=2841695 RepID=A0A8J6NVA5_9BACT|nr:restriction endonuclease subunit S [Candidatus Desulfatibia profunda]MBL7180114.1 restriction endonuclease subunit S [Desulfobacterales bacterium]
MSWETIRLGEFLTLKRGYDLPSARRQEGNSPVVSSSGITGYHNVAMVEGPGVVTGRYGTLGQVFFVPEDFWPLNTALYVQDFKGNDPRFSAYFLKSILTGTSSDKAAVPGVNRNDLHARKVTVTRDRSQQRAIASILSAYDDLIENNRRRIQLLEQSARLLYKEWFVHLRFPGHEHVKITDGVPEGWKKKPLGEIAPLKYGKALKKDVREPGDFPVFGSSGEIGTHQKALVQGPGIIVGRKGNVGSVFWCEDDFYPIDTVYFISSENSNLYLYYALLHTAFMSTDVAVPGLNRDFAHSRNILLSESKIEKLFDDIVISIHKQIHGLRKYNENLAKARDLLLPRLINGEIVV